MNQKDIKLMSSAEVLEEIQFLSPYLEKLSNFIHKFDNSDFLNHCINLDTDITPQLQESIFRSVFQARSSFSFFEKLSFVQELQGRGPFKGYEPSRELKEEINTLTSCQQAGGALDLANLDSLINIKRIWHLI